MADSQSALFRTQVQIKRNADEVSTFMNELNVRSILFHSFLLPELSCKLESSDPSFTQSAHLLT